jgi:2-hydroxychromene-2-carboxylate isomerase
MSKTIQYYFAPLSPWAYLGHERLVALAREKDALIEIKPFDIGRVFSVSGGLPLAKRAPQRQAYRLVELERWSKHLGLPLNLQPKFFPIPPDTASKLILATRTGPGTDAALALTGALMRALWAEDRNIADEATQIQIANSCGLDGAMLFKASETPGMQAEFDRMTDDAIAANVFGVPWYVVDGESFWGQDRLDFVARAL